MKRYFCFLLMIIGLPLLLGMGAQGGVPTDKIPVPAKKFTATYIDQTDVTTECMDASIEGTTFLDGKKGEGTFAVAFENIQQIVFRQYAEKFYGQITLRDGSSLELVISKDRKAYGRTKFGTFQIRLNDLKKMIIDPALQKKI
ncbi:MAG: hypothetical protein NTZ57_05815 [Deltaproteobacteria bacterium]|nr:hypothetical protein [Deltaproteobacteria bacterium]